MYVDLNDEIIDTNTMNVKDLYQPTHNDHHLVKHINLYNILISKIKNFIL